MKINLEKLFGSSLKVKILVHFLGASKRPYALKEVAAKIRASKRKILKELVSLKKIGLLRTSRLRKTTFFQLNMKCLIYKELKALVFKVAKLPEDKMFQKLRRTGDIRYALLTGFFTQARGVITDLLIVGRISPKKFNSLIKRIEGRVGREINYTVMTLNEFNYRQSAGDQFLTKIKSNEYIVLIDRLKKGKRKQQKK